MSDTIDISGNAIKKVSLSKRDINNVKKVTSLMVDIVKRQRTLWRKEINDWQSARLLRHSKQNPRNYLIQDVYEDAMMDGHLTAVTENRTLRTTNKSYCFAINGKKDDTLTEYIKNKEWFEKLIQEAHESTYYGGTLFWVKEWEKGNIKEIMLVPRERVIPELNVLLKDIHDNKGFDYTDAPDLLWYAQFYSLVGLLEKAAVFTILKRHSWGSWDEFEELFGVPIRIAKIAAQSDKVKNEVADWLKEMGTAAYGVFPLGTEVEIKENNKSDAFNVFYQKIKALDKELSKMVIHQTMTTEDGASRAQGNIHENTLKEIIFADEKKMLSFLNNRIVPAMRNLGYKIPDNAKIIVEKTKDPKEQIKIDEILINGGYVLKLDYIIETYGTQVIDSPKQKEIPIKEGKD